MYGDGENPFPNLFWHELGSLVYALHIMQNGIPIR